MIHLQALQSLVTSVMTDWIISKSNWERYTMLKLAKCGRSLSFGCYFVGTGTVAFGLFFHLIKFHRFMHQPQRPMVYPFPYPYNVQKSPNYEITFFIQVCGGLYSALVNCTVDSFVSTLVLHMCSQLINLRTTLRNLIEEVADKSMSSSRFREKLGAIIIRHEHVIRYVKVHLKQCVKCNK